MSTAKRLYSATAPSTLGSFRTLNKPPKQGSAKKKLSKAEKEKLKAEEEERKAAEEEEARIRAEEEEKQRKAQEKVAQAERRKLENAEKATRRMEMLQLVEIQEKNRNQLNNLHEERRKKSKWARYMRCDGSPDPTIPGEINTYINLKLEDKEHNDIDSVLKTSELDLTLINELMFLIDDTPGSELSLDDAERYQTTMEDLQMLMQTKLDAATVQVLQRATELCDPETFNLHYLNKNSEVCLCVWGNLSKNPRIKSFEFPEKGFQFDIPKILTLSDCGFRILFTKYDHYSNTCKSYYSRKKRKEEPVPVVEEKEEEKKDDEEEKKDEEEEKEEQAEDKEDTEDLMAMLREMKGEPAEEKKEEEPEEEKVDEVEEFEDPITPEPQEYEDFEEDEDVMDLRANHVLGGVFHFNLVSLPPQPKTVNNWTITRMVDPPNIEYMEYQADLPPVNKEGQSPGGQDGPAVTSARDQKAEKGEAKRDEKPPICVNLRLPEGCLFTEEPQIARWDYKHKYWRLDGFTDFNYNEEARTFQFKTCNFGTMALLQDAHINMPFQSWELRPHKANSAVLTIIAAIIEIEIEIKDSMCCLSKPDDKPEIADLRNKWMTPKDLIRSLRNAGINVFPADDSSKYVSIQNKHPVIEEWCYEQMALKSSGFAFSWSKLNSDVQDREKVLFQHPVIEEWCYEQMALISSGFAFSWSKWNSDVQDREKILFQAAEALEDEPLLEEDWGLFLMTKKRSMKLKMTEFDETYTEDLADETEFKSNLYHLISLFATEQAKDRIQESDFQYIDCVTQLLSATKVLTYA